jgi:hypothetical protein
VVTDCSNLFFSLRHGQTDDEKLNGWIRGDRADAGVHIAMNGRSKFLVLVLLLSLGIAGCCHDCPPKHLFSFIDRNCFVADWMNDHSCTSCRYCANNVPATVITSRVYTADTDPVPSASK